MQEELDNAQNAPWSLRKSQHIICAGAAFGWHPPPQKTIVTTTTTFPFLFHTLYAHNSTRLTLIPLPFSQYEDVDSLEDAVKGDFEEFIAKIPLFETRFNPANSVFEFRLKPEANPDEWSPEKKILHVCLFCLCLV